LFLKNQKKNQKKDTNNRKKIRKTSPVQKKMNKILCSLLLAVICVIAFSSSSSVVLAQDGCANFNTIASCATAAAQSPPKLCVWDDSKGCIKDPCLELTGNVSCAAGPGCLYMPWSTGATCFASYLLCANLGTSNCKKYPFCTVRENTYCGTVGVIGVNKVKTECDVNFPSWSVALIIVWLIIMVILGFIVLLAMGKSKQQKVAAVEKDDDVVVDSVQIRDDNFQLGDPLNQGTDE